MSSTTTDLKDVLRDALADTLKSYTTDQLTEMEKHGCRALRARVGGPDEKAALHVLLDAIDNEMVTRGYDFCFETRAYATNHEMKHCL